MIFNFKLNWIEVYETVKLDIDWWIKIIENKRKIKELMSALRNFINLFQKSVSVVVDSEHQTLAHMSYCTMKPTSIF